MPAPVSEISGASLEGEDQEVKRQSNLTSKDEENWEKCNTKFQESNSKEANNKIVKRRLHNFFLEVFGCLPTIGDKDIEESYSEFEDSLHFGAKQIIQLIIPVFMCMLVVVIFQLGINVYDTRPQGKLLYLPFEENNSNTGINILYGLINAIVFVAFVAVMTIVLVLLLKYRCDRAIFAWLLVASSAVMFIVSAIYFYKILTVQNLIIDWFTFAFLIWNFGSIGLMVIHWKGPLIIQQGFLILSSAIVAIVMVTYFADWTTWIILIAISVYDIFAVLCPKGPLKILIKITKERGDINFPSLLYSSTTIWQVGMAVSKKFSENGIFTDVRTEKVMSTSSELKDSRPCEKVAGEDMNKTEACSDEQEKIKTHERLAQSSDRDSEIEVKYNTEHEKDRKGEVGDTQSFSKDGIVEEEVERKGIKLGLGDFIFYSVLVGKAASISEGNWLIIFSCFVAILMGLCLTSLVLGIVRRSLPALPVSIFFGLVFYFASQYILAPYVEVLNVNQVFI